MGSSISVNRTNFDASVLQTSHEKPVLVDFFAQWCGPCQMLKPMLERLVQEYDFVLAKVDIDANPELAQEYGVQGVPDVRIAIDGTLHEGFVGVLPEAQLRELMAQLNLKSALEQSLEAAYSAAAAGRTEEAQTLIDGLVQQHPNNFNLILQAANFYLQDLQQFDKAEQLLSKIPDHDREYAPYARILKAEGLFQRATQEPATTESDRTFQQAAQAALAKDYETALMLFMEIVSRDRAYKNDAGRKAMLAVFDILGDDHPVTRHYRKVLTTALY